MVLKPLTWFDLNEAALKRFVNLPVSSETARHLACRARRAIGQNRRAHVRTDQYLDTPALEDFILRLIMSTNLRVRTVMSALVYLSRLETKLRQRPDTRPYAAQGAFLAALMLSARRLDTNPPSNAQWAVHSQFDTGRGVFGIEEADVDLMEEEAKALMEYDTTISDHDLYSEMDPFLRSIRVAVASTHAGLLCWVRKQISIGAGGHGDEYLFEENRAIQAAEALMLFSKGSC